MAERKYDTRSREEILAAVHFAPYLERTRIREIGLRELRTLDAFFVWAETRGVEVPRAADFLAFAEGTTSARQLENLRTAFDRIVPEDAPVRRTIRAAIGEKRGSARRCERRSREQIVAAPHFAPYRHLAALDAVALEDLRVLDRFLAFAAARHIQIPAVEDFLRFTDDTTSSRRLRSLKQALDQLLPGNPAVLLTLQEAIRTKGKRPEKGSTTSRRAPRYRMSLAELPREWQAALEAMRLGEEIGGRRPPAPSTLRNMEEILREYAQVTAEASLPVAITVEGVRALEAARADRAENREVANYRDEGNRPATRHTAVQRLRAFAEHLRLEPHLVADLRAHENRLRCTLGTVVPLKFAKLDALPGLAETWQLAANLREQSVQAKRRQTALRLLNEAAVLALWTLLPLRLADGRLRWGADILWTGTGYQADIDTRKADVPIQGRLHPVLSPFLDALVLNGMDPAYLEAMRADALARQLPLFRNTAGRMLARTYPSTVWARHMGAGAHLSRSRVHTELGRLGPEGVEAALALCAQRDPRSAAFYQGQAVSRAMVDHGQDLVDALLDEEDPDAG